MVIKVEVKFDANSEIGIDGVTYVSSLSKGSTVADMVVNELKKAKLDERYEVISVKYQSKKRNGLVEVDLSNKVKKNGKYIILVGLRHAVPKEFPVSPILKSVDECAEKNILFLSETGNGKSTFINAFKNYVNFPSLDDALQAARNGVSICLIPTSFSISLDGKHQDVTVGDRDDKNENTTSKGRSATRCSASYVFDSGLGRLRLIDTPGMGDVDGLDQDKKNIANILHHISSLNSIHCICILLKPNCPRLTVGFKYCLSELLAHLHKSAAKNIVFCFTGSRGTQYQPGDTLDALREFLREVEEKNGVSIALGNSTKYCLDNDSFRFLCASTKDVQHNESDRQWYAESWSHSVKEINRLLRHVAGLNAHSTESTILLNEARRTIEIISPVLAKVSQAIQSNLSGIEEKKAEIQKIEVLQGDLAEKLMIPVVTIEVRKLEYPRTVCAAGKHMSTFKDLNGTVQVIYNTICHDKCYLRKQTENIFPNPALQDCEIMGVDGGDCINCGCLWSEHMHTFDESFEQKKMVENSEVVDLMATSNDSKETVKKTIDILVRIKKGYETEQALINKTAAKFGYFLKRNAIVPWSDSMKDYIKLAIREAQVIAEETGDWSKVEGLYKSLAEYENQKILIEQEGDSNQGSLMDDASSIKSYYEELISMELCGENIKQLFEQAAEDHVVQFIEHECPISACRGADPPFLEGETTINLEALVENDQADLEGPRIAAQERESVVKKMGKKFLNMFYPLY